MLPLDSKLAKMEHLADFDNRTISPRLIKECKNSLVRPFLNFACKTGPKHVQRKIVKRCEGGVRLTKDVVVYDQDQCSSNSKFVEQILATIIPQNKL